MPVPAGQPQGRPPKRPSPPWPGFPRTSCPWFPPQVGAIFPRYFPPSTDLTGICPVGVHSASLLYFAFPSLCAPPVLTQPPPASASLGASAKLTCTLSSEHSTYTIQQQSGKAPHYIKCIKRGRSHSEGDGIPIAFHAPALGLSAA